MVQVKEEIFERDWGTEEKAVTLDVCTTESILNLDSLTGESFTFDADEQSSCRLSAPSTSHESSTMDTGAVTGTDTGGNGFGGIPNKLYMNIERLLTDDKDRKLGRDEVKERRRLLHAGYRLKDGQLVHQGKFVLLLGEAEKVLQDIHDKIEHQGGAWQMRQLVHDHFTYLDGNGSLEEDVNRIIEQCPTCQDAPSIDISEDLTLSVQVIEDDTRRFAVTVTVNAEMETTFGTDEVEKTPKIRGKPFGGLPAWEYDEIVHFVKTGNRPSFDNPEHTWNFKTHSKTFTLDEEGLLLRKGRYVLQDCESEEVLRELHVKAGHPKAATIRKVGNKFTYAGHKKYLTEDLWRVVEECEDCKFTGAPLLHKNSPRWNEIYCSVRRAKPTRIQRLEVTVHGFEPNEVEMHHRFLRKQTMRREKRKHYSRNPEYRSQKKEDLIFTYDPNRAPSPSEDEYDEEELVKKRRKSGQNLMRWKEKKKMSSDLPSGNLRKINGTTMNLITGRNRIEYRMQPNKQRLQRSRAVVKRRQTRTSLKAAEVTMEQNPDPEVVLPKRKLLQKRAREEATEQNPDVVLPVLPKEETTDNVDTKDDSGSSQHGTLPFDQSDVINAEDLLPSGSSTVSYVCTPLGNIKCVEGYVPCQPSFSMQQKKGKDGNCSLTIQAFMKRRENDVPIVNTGFGDEEDAECFIMTTHGKIKVPEGFRCINSGSMEVEDGDLMTVEIYLQLQKLQHKRLEA